MIGYKASYNSKCINITYETGKNYDFNGKLKLCRQGFHFCKKPDDIFKFYPYNNNEFVLFEVEIPDDAIVVDERNKIKSVTNKLKIKRIIPKKEYNNLFQKHIFDENNNIIYQTNLYKYEWFWKYDKNNNLIYEKKPNGKEWFYEFDENNHMIYQKDSNGIELFYKYDENNNKIYQKNSYNNEHFYGYDENNNKNYQKDSKGNVFSIEIK